MIGSIVVVVVVVVVVVMIVLSDVLTVLPVILENVFAETLLLKLIIYHSLDPVAIHSIPSSTETSGKIKSSR